MGWVLLVLVRFYRLLLSPVYHALFGPCCRFEPTCSAYAEQALKQHGAWRGLWLAALRLARCHPLARAGFDPVPERRQVQVPAQAQVQVQVQVQVMKGSV